MPNAKLDKDIKKKQTPNKNKQTKKNHHTTDQ